MDGGQRRWEPVVERQYLAFRSRRAELERLGVSDAMKAASFLAGVVGKAHARQMDVATRKSWSNELNRHRSKSLEAPSWLWTSVVALVGAHEIA
jgi:uncharacterized protein (DUF2252 family)